MRCGQVEQTLDGAGFATQRGRGRLESLYRKLNWGQWSLRGDRRPREHEPGGVGVPTDLLARLTDAEVREALVEERRLGMIAGGWPTSRRPAS